MVSTGIYRLVFVALRTHQLYESSRWSDTPADIKRIEIARAVLRDEKPAGCRGCGGSGDDELVSGKTRALIGLEHPVAESILLGHLKVGLNLGWIDVLELWVRRGADLTGNLDSIRPIHSAAVVHGYKRRMRMTQVIVGTQRR